MPVIPDTQIAQVAAAAGIPADQISTAVAIALAESGGNTESHNTIPPDNSYGLWQINMLGALGPQRRKAFNLGNNNNLLFDPAVNAKAMASISNGGKNWAAWTTFTSGKYALYKLRGDAAAKGNNLTAPAPDTNSSGGGNGLTDALHFFEFIGNPKNWIYIGMWFFGAALLLFGIWELGKNTKVVKSAKNSAKSVTKAAAVAKLVK